MIKLMFTVKKRDGMSSAEFKKYYEEKHVKLIEESGPKIPTYRRNYIVNGASFGPLEGKSDKDAGFDCITEAIWETREQAEAHMRFYLEKRNYEIIAADEERFIAPGGLNFYIVESHESPR